MQRRCGQTNVFPFNNIDYAFKHDKSRTLIQTFDFKRAQHLVRQMMWLINLHEMKFTFVQCKLDFTLGNKSTIRIMTVYQNRYGLRFNNEKYVE